MKKKNENEVAMDNLVKKTMFPMSVLFWLILVTVGVSINYGLVFYTDNPAFKNFINGMSSGTLKTWSEISFYLMFIPIMGYAYVSKLYIKMLEKMEDFEKTEDFDITDEETIKKVTEYFGKL